MWMIDNQTPYAAERTWLRDTTGAHVWMVAVRATFSIASNGQLSLADEQTAPKMIAEYSGEPGRSSLLYEADLGHIKPSTDVTLLGSAYAPGRRAASSVVAGLRLPGVSKAIEVFGERFYTAGPLGTGTSEPTPFLRQPIRYEAAFGGTGAGDPDPSQHVRDARNPVGRGVAAQRGAPDTLAHTLEYPGTNPAAAGPAGFGPIPGYWAPRRAYAGTYDERWARERKPLLPLDFDARFALCAPADQALSAYLRGGEVFELLNLTPEGLLRFELPAIRLAFMTLVDGRRTEHQGQYASVIVEPDESRLSVVIQTALPVSAHDADYLDFTTVRPA